MNSIIYFIVIIRKFIEFPYFSDIVFNFRLTMPEYLLSYLYQSDYDWCYSYRQIIEELVSSLVVATKQNISWLEFKKQ